MKWKRLILSTMLAVSMVPTSYAASQDECAIWLCLPTGFPSGCDGAKKAFRHRMRHFKPPLPAFSSCNVGSNTYDFTAKAPCIHWHKERHGFHHRKVCDRWQVQIYQKGQAYEQPYIFNS